MTGRLTSTQLHARRLSLSTPAALPCSASGLPASHPLIRLTARSRPLPHALPRAAVLQQAAALPHNLAAWPLLALMALTVYAAFPPALAGAIEEDFGFMSVGKWLLGW